MFTVERLGPSHLKQAHELFTMMAQVFEEERAVLPDEYVQRLLQRGVHNLLHGAVVAKVNDLGTGRLENATHDVD